MITLEPSPAEKPSDINRLVGLRTAARKKIRRCLPCLQHDKENGVVVLAGLTRARGGRMSGWGRSIVGGALSPERPAIMADVGQTMVAMAELGHAGQRHHTLRHEGGGIAESCRIMHRERPASRFLGFRYIITFGKCKRDGRGNMGARGPKSAAALTTPGRSAVRCIFCGKRDYEVRRLIAGPERVALICNECVEAAHELLREEG
jgi:hypothetical protein